jgi:Predicted metal-dependent RNase, consists of a metallo-beta-lactamase domain and an RNA-binding KH domain
MANQGTFDTFAEIKKVVLREIPADARLTKVEFEGPNIVVYVQNPNLLIENSEPVKRIVHEIKKRIIIRADPSAREDPGGSQEDHRGDNPERGRDNRDEL